MGDINLDDYKSNSNASKTDVPVERKVEPVISGGSRLAKKGPVKRFFGKIFGDYDPSSKSIFTNVVVPQLKKMLDDSFHTFLFPNGGNNDRRPDRMSRISYRNYYDNRDDFPRETTKPLPAGVMDYDDVIFETRGKAERVLEGMHEHIERYRVVSVADFYDMSEIDDMSYTTNRYGWTDLRTARVVPYGREYKIRLPKAMPID